MGVGENEMFALGMEFSFDFRRLTVYIYILDVVILLE